MRKGVSVDVEASGRSPVGRPKTFDRDRVVGIAVESYWRDGVDGVSLNELCRRADVSKPGLYREFGGEDGVMDAALERYAVAVLAPNMERLTGDEPFADVLASMVNLLTDIDRAGPAGCLLVKMQHAPSRLGPAVRARVHALRRAARIAYADWVILAKQRGEIAPDVAIDVAAAFIDIQCSTLLVQMALGEDPGLLRAQARLAFVGLTARSSQSG